MGNIYDFTSDITGGGPSLLRVKDYPELSINKLAELVEVLDQYLEYLLSLNQARTALEQVSYKPYAEVRVQIESIGTSKPMVIRPQDVLSDVNSRIAEVETLIKTTVEGVENILSVYPLDSQIQEIRNDLYKDGVYQL